MRIGPRDVLAFVVRLVTWTMIGMLVALPALGTYHLLEWRLADNDPHERGMTVGVTMMVVLNISWGIAKTIIQRHTNRSDPE